MFLDSVSAHNPHAGDWSLDPSHAPATAVVLDIRSLSRCIIGNDFTIRHHERGKHDLADDSARDYLLIRQPSLIAFVLRQAGRMAT